ncbi:MAG: helix-turn-helix transcriptional regulator [Lachnospiraceae bacterium]|nr:helix-turn-helix transcriptional regulator [Lachnospiraceae bacterium]
MSKSKSVSLRNAEFYVELSYNIAYYRKRAGMTQEELAEKIDISRSHLSAIEAPNIIRPFSLEILFDIATALDIEPYKLFKISEP